MKREPIPFTTLLEHVLPLERLSPADRERIAAAVRSGDAAAVERAGFFALERLAALGAIVRLPDRGEGAERVVRFQRPDVHSVVALRFPVPSPVPGVEALPRALVMLSASAPLERVRRLLALDDAAHAPEGRLPSGPIELVARLTGTARELLAADSAAFFPTSARGDAAGAYAPPPGEAEILGAWSRPYVHESDHVVVCRDATLAPALRAAAAHAGARSIAAVRVRATVASLAGALEVRSANADHFTPERLSLLSLLAENFGALADQSARLERIVFVDALTGVSNNAFFRQALGNEVARSRRENKSMALVIADIDDFKRFNTTYGYEGGNTVLKQVAHALRGAVRPFDVVARWGGEEFAVLLTSPLAREDAETIAERLRAAVADAEHAVTGLDGMEHRVRVTISLGAALFPDDCQTPEDLWRRANQALLEAKKPPKNRVVFFGGRKD